MAHCQPQPGCPASYGQRPAECEIWHGSHRNMCKGRSRHCFVVRTPPVSRLRPCRKRQPDDCCCYPEKSLSRRQPDDCCCYPEKSLSRRQPDDCCCYPEKSLSRRQPDDCCCYPEKSLSRRSVCVPPEPVSQPRCRRVPSSTDTDCCCPPQEQATCCVPKSRLRDTRRPVLPSSNLPVPQRRTHLNQEDECSSYSDQSGQVQSFAPAVQALNPSFQEPRDPYYNYDRYAQSTANVDPLANFNLNRFDQDNMAHGGDYGRRRNVSIRTCVDYDYEPGNSRGPQSYPKRSHTYQKRSALRSSLRQPEFVPTQRNLYNPPPVDSAPQSREIPDRYVPCRYRR